MKVRFRDRKLKKQQVSAKMGVARTKKSILKWCLGLSLALNLLQLFNNYY